MRIGRIGRRRTTGYALLVCWGAVAALLLEGVGAAGAAPFAYVADTGNNVVSVLDLATHTVAATIPVGTAPFGVAVSPATSRAYVVNMASGSLSVIDTTTNSVVATIPVPEHSRGVAVDPTGARVYVANSEHDTVSVIDAATNSVTATVEVQYLPWAVAVHPVGTRAYVTNQGDNSVSVIDTATNAVTATVPVGTGPLGLAVHPTGTRVYVANQFSNSVSVISTATHTVTATIPVGTGPVAVALNPAGTRLYVASINGDSVSVIDTASNRVMATLSVPASPWGVAVHPAGTRVYVAQWGSGTVAVINATTNTVSATLPVGGVLFAQSISSGATGGIPAGYMADTGRDSVVVFDLASHTVAATIPVGTAPFGVAVSPATSRAYVVNMASGTLSVVDTTTNSVVATIPVPEHSRGVAVDPTGTRVYVTNTDSHTVSVIDTATNAVTATVDVGQYPWGVTIDPAGTWAYVTNQGDNTVSMIDIATSAVRATVPVGMGPLDVAVHPSGARVYVANQFSNSVSVIGTATHTVTATIPVGTGPVALALNPAGTRLYVANTDGNTVSVVDTASNRVTATVPIPASPWGVAVHPVGTRVYVAQWGSGTVSVIDAATNAVTATLPIGSGPLSTGGSTGWGPKSFAPLMVGKGGRGSGTVTSAPAGIACGAECNDSYPTGSLVILTATPAFDSVLTGWGGCDSTDGNRCRVSMGTARRVTATFGRSIYRLAVTRDGAGTVTSVPQGIDCGVSCTKGYEHGSIVTLVATPLAGNQFVGWDGACGGTFGVCRVTMDAAQGVTAAFRPLPPRITAFAPAAGAVGARVVVNGYLFGTVRGALIFPSGAAASVKFWSASRIEATVPANAGSGSVTLTTADGRTATASYTAGSPVVAAIGPVNAETGGVVTLTGVRFGSVAGSVVFSGVSGPVAASALPRSWYDTSVRVTVPVGAATGDVTLTTADGQTASRHFPLLGPAVEAVTPPGGAAGIRLTLSGRRFGSSPGGVTFAGALGAVAGTVKRWTAGNVEVAVPVGASTGLLTLTTADGRTATRPFTVPSPRLTSLNRSSGVPGGVVALVGADFGLTAGTVTFTGAAGPVAASLAPGAIWGNTGVKVTVPDGAVSGPVTLTRADGLTSSSAFTVLAPTITRVTPIDVVSGSVVTISGANFGVTPGTVSFPGLTTPVPVILAPGTTWGNTRISLTVPPGAVAGTITLTTAGGSSASGYLTLR
jgi:YVTN family beta-propeller protein